MAPIIGYAHGLSDVQSPATNARGTNQGLPEASPSEMA